MASGKHKIQLLLIARYQLELDELEYFSQFKARRRRRFWVRDIYRERNQKGEYHLLVKQAKLFDPEIFFQMFRMSSNKFEELLRLIAPYITKDSLRREPISPEERLSVTLRYLATGDSFKTISTSYRMSDTTVGRIIKETSNIIWEVLQKEGFLDVPKTSKEWKLLGEQFERKWNFPNCIGAIDGKHVIIQCPPRGGSMYFNYKKFHSIVLMATVNANYEFIMVDIGDYGRLSDGSVFSSSNLGYAINNDTLNIPPPQQLDDNPTLYPYVFVGDDAFPLKPCLLKPYPGQKQSVEERIFNYRLSRARRIVENAFGIATSRFRVFRRPICANVETATAITKAVVVLHNFLMRGLERRSKFQYYTSELIDKETNEGVIIDGLWRTEAFNEALGNISSMGSNNYSVLAKNVRDNFKRYFCSVRGSLPWQLSYVQSTSNSFDN